MKTTDDLLVIRSDRYRLDEAYRVVPRSPSSPPTLVELDRRYYRLVQELDDLFPNGPPSLDRCSRLSVRGQVRFGRDVTVVGEVSIVNDTEEVQRVDDGRTLEGTVHWP